MSTAFRCDDKETLVAYIYDELDRQLRREISAHLRTCAECADDIEGLRGVRRDLAAWQPPEAELNFAIVHQSATVLRPPRWSTRSVPGWMQAAAAVVLLAGGAAVANLQVHYGDEGLTISTGWIDRGASVMPTGATAAAGSIAAPAPEWQPALAALESNLRRELEVAKSTPPAQSIERSAGTQAEREALLRRVEALVEESERRQRQELAVRMAQFGRDVQGDLFRMNQGFRQLQGRTGLVEGNQREIVNLVNQVRRVSTQVP